MNASLPNLPVVLGDGKINLSAFLGLLHPGLDPRQIKVHCAQHNRVEDPLDVYLSGRFEEWQRWQKQLNFERPYVVSLIATGQKDLWMFAGLHRSSNTTDFRDQYHYYPLVEEPSCASLKGRLFVHFNKYCRNCYLYGERHMPNMTVTELREIPLSVARFPGFRKVDLSYDELCLVHRQRHQDWVAALSSVAGVYLITDTLEGRLYVGSASGQGGIWQRWSDYAVTGHGENVELKALLAGTDKQRARHLRYAILEIADVHDPVDSIEGRETHWKKILLSRTHGMNRN